MEQSSGAPTISLLDLMIAVALIIGLPTLFFGLAWAAYWATKFNWLGWMH